MARRGQQDDRQTLKLDRKASFALVRFQVHMSNASIYFRLHHAITACQMPKSIEAQRLRKHFRQGCFEECLLDKLLGAQGPSLQPSRVEAEAPLSQHIDSIQVVASAFARDLEGPICQRVCYQPLTLQSCLYTFRAACVRTSFVTQACLSTQLLPEYTCMMCRTGVARACENTTIRNLLDIWVGSSAESARSESEVRNAAEVYNVGDV